MRRREFVAIAGSAAAAWPVVASAQQAKLPVVGFLSSASRISDASRLKPFLEGLNAAGFNEGDNVTIETRWSEGQYDRLANLAADLVGRDVAVIVTGGIASALAAKSTTRTIPIVSVAGTDPLKAGLVSSLNRPGGNITGVTQMGHQSGPKRLELVQQVIPRAKIVGALLNPASPDADMQSRDLQFSALTLGLQLHVLNASTVRDFDATFVRLKQLHADGLVIAADSFFNSQCEKLAALSAYYAVPTIYHYREFAAAGGLMSYGTKITGAFRAAGIYTGRILMGEKPANLPYQQSSRVELIINLKAARALGIDMPRRLLDLADEVIG